MLRAVLYHSGAELVTDWPAVFASHGFRVVECQDIISETPPTWEHARAVYERRDGEVTCRYGRRLTERHTVTFTSAAAAQAAGYRPCKVCRP